MTIQREAQLVQIKELLIQSESWIKADRFLQHQNSYIELEYFFRDLLNLVYGWELGNANALFGRNQDSFDLSDEVNRIAAQVTVTTSAEKIRKTLSTFIGTHDDQYKRLVFVYPRIDPGNSRADFSQYLNGYDFDPARDRIGFGSILAKAQDMTVDEQSRLLNLLQKELGIARFTPWIVLSYRREDSEGITKHIAGRLESQFGRDSVLAVSGVEAPKTPMNFLDNCDALIPIIGRDWLSAATPDGTRRLDNPNDHVRLHIASAIDQRIPIIPVLVGQAQMPQADELPSSIRQLSECDGVSVRPDPDINYDIARLLASLRSRLPAPVAGSAQDCILDLALVEQPDESCAPAELHFSLTNVADAHIKVVSIRLQVDQCDQYNEIAHSKALAQVKDYFLEAHLEPSTTVCDLLEHVHVLSPNETDGFVLRVHAEEGWRFLIKIIVEWWPLGSGCRSSAESPQVELAYPIRSLEGLSQLLKERRLSEDRNE